MATPAWIGLGSNLGDRRATLAAALDALDGADGVLVRDLSALYETAPVGGPAGQGAFLNAAARLDTTLNPFELLDRLQAIEGRLGRARGARWGERTLDLDLLLFGSSFLNDARLQIPHPRMGLRRFVLEPLAEIAPGAVDAVSRRTVGELLANLDRRPRLVALDGDGPIKAEVFGRLVDGLPAIGLAGGDADPTCVDDGDDGPYLLASIDNRLHSLDAARWDAGPAPDGWIVADFDLRADLRKAEGRDGLRDGPADEIRERRDVRREAADRLRRGIDRTLTPTFIAILPGPNLRARRAWQPPIPLLWPPGEDPTALAAEILATCRGIQSPAVASSRIR